MLSPDAVYQADNQLGECILWDWRLSKVLWVDIEGKTFWSCDPDLREPEFFETPERIGSFALTNTPGTYLVACESGFARFTPASKNFELIAPIIAGLPHLRMNDGRTDRSGTFWAGCMDEREEYLGSPEGGIWKLHKEQTGQNVTSAFFGNLRIPNSICWSLDGKIMYFADSAVGSIMKTTYNPESGPIGKPEVFAGPPPKGAPDGSCIDSEGHLWNAIWGGGQLIRYRPNGAIERIMQLRVSQPTCICFGGDKLDRIFVTSARIHLSDSQLMNEPLAGSLLAFDIGHIGILEAIAR